MGDEPPSSEDEQSSPRDEQPSTLEDKPPFSLEDEQPSTSGDELPSPPVPIPPRAMDYTRLREEAQQARNNLPTSQYTVDDAIETVGLGRFQYALVALTGLCWTAESMEMLLLSFIKAPLQCQWGISDAQAALITTSVGLGMLFGSAVWGLLGDKYGRRIAFISSTAFIAVFGITSALAVNYPMILIARGLVGFGTGGVPISFSILMEFLPASKRGSWGMSLAFFWSFGAIFESLVAMLVVPTLGWRWLIGFSTIPLCIVLLMSFWLKESPRWLISKGSVGKAREVLESLSRTNGVPLPEGTLTRAEEIDTENRQEITEQRRRGGLLRPGARSLAFKLWYLWLAIAFAYYGLVMLQPELISRENVGERCNYAKNECGALSTEGSCKGNEICAWRNGTTNTCHPKGIVGGTKEASACARKLTKEDFMSALWSSSGELPGILIAIFVVDIIGRRPLLGYMFGLTAISFVLLLTCIGRVSETIVFFVGRAVSTGAFQGVYLYTNEIYPAKVRASAMGISSSVARVGLIASPFVAQYLENINHVAAVWLYFAVVAVCVLVVMLIPIETTGRPLLSSMQELVSILKAGNAQQGDDLNSPTFAKDPAVSRFVRFFRWKAKVDGEIR